MVLRVLRRSDFYLLSFDPFKVIARRPVTNEDSEFSPANCTAVPGGQGQSWSLLTPAPLLPLQKRSITNPRECDSVNLKRWLTS